MKPRILDIDIGIVKISKPSKKSDQSMLLEIFNQPYSEEGFSFEPVAYTTIHGTEKLRELANLIWGYCNDNDEEFKKK